MDDNDRKSDFTLCVYYDVRVCERVVHVSRTTASCVEFRFPENVSKRVVPEALFAGSLLLFAKLYT